MYKIEVLGKSGRIFAYSVSNDAELFDKVIALWDCNNISAISIQDTDNNQLDLFSR